MAVTKKSLINKPAADKSTKSRSASTAATSPAAASKPVAAGALKTAYRPAHPFKSPRVAAPLGTTRKIAGPIL
jgi:hypothetical protein